MSIDQNQLAFELYKTKGHIDDFYYRAVTGEKSSNATIRATLANATEGFEESDVSKERFLQDYVFEKYPVVRDWVRHYAELGLRLKASDLFTYMQEVDNG